LQRNGAGRCVSLRKLKAPKSRAGKAAVLILINIAVMLISAYLLKQPSILETELHEVQGETNYDTIVVGDSHGETAVDPDVLDGKLGTTSFNCARRIMPVKDIYYLIREVSYRNDPKTILYELDPFYWTVPGISLGNDTSVFFAGTDPKNRMDYFLNEMLQQPFANVIADYRFAPRNAAQIPGTAWVKLQPAYLRHEDRSIPMIMKALYLGENYEYRGRGFRYGTTWSAALNRSYSYEKFRAKNVPESNLEYFHKMAEFCREKGVRLVCFYSALPPYRLRNENEYDAHDFFTRLCAEEGVEYYDMNYLKADLLPRTDYDYVDVDGHMLGELAERQTSVLAEILASDRPQMMFVDSYDEVLAGLPEFMGMPGIDPAPWEETESETEAQTETGAGPLEAETEPGPETGTGPLEAETEPGPETGMGPLEAETEPETEDMGETRAGKTG